MMKQNLIHPLWLLLVVLLQASCSAEQGSFAADDEEDGIPGQSVRVIVNDLSEHATRALHESLSQFSETVLNARGGYATNANFLYKNPNAEGWITSNAWTIPKSGNLTAYAVSPTFDILDEYLFNKSDRYFDYTTPVKENQTVVKIGSKLNFTSNTIAEEDGLIINFSNATAFLVVRATNKLQLKLKNSEEKIPVQVYVKTVIMHNLKTKGRFTFNASKETDGSWTLDDGIYSNFTQDLQEAVLVTNGQTDPTDILDSALVVLPQSPENWAWAAKGKEDAGPEDAVSVANTNHKCYVELKCQITATIDGNTYYVWGSADGVERSKYETIYLPYNGRLASPKYIAVGATGVYKINIAETTALDENGKPIKPKESALGDQSRDAEFVNFSTADDDGNDNVDDWAGETETEVITL